LQTLNSADIKQALLYQFNIKKHAINSNYIFRLNLVLYKFATDIFDFVIIM